MHFQGYLYTAQQLYVILIPARKFLKIVFLVFSKCIKIKKYDSRFALLLSREPVSTNKKGFEQTEDVLFCHHRKDKSTVRLVTFFANLVSNRRVVLPNKAVLKFQKYTKPTPHGGHRCRLCCKFGKFYIVLTVFFKLLRTVFFWCSSLFFWL